MRKNTNRFQLHRQTLRDLGNDALQRAAGGMMKTITESEGCEPPTTTGGGVPNTHTCFTLSCSLGYQC
jgi:hypothetical protein